MSKCDLGVYKDKRVLITGNTGFKGSWLSAMLIQLGARVIGYSLGPPTKPSMFEAIGLENKYTNLVGDVRDEKHLLATFRKHKPEFVFHLAAQPIVRRSYKEPSLTFQTNTMGTVNLLESVRNTTSAKVVVVITSDKCYENKELLSGCKETDPMGGSDPYSASKGCAELVVSAYRASFFDRKRHSAVGLASVRAGNVIGGGDWGEDRLLPDCVRSLSAGKKIEIRNPASIRPWQHVLEPLGGYLLLGAKLVKDKGRYAGAWNFGPLETDAISVEEIVKRVISYWGTGKYTVRHQKNQPPEARSLRLDCSKAHELMGWKSTYGIDKALKETVAWYKEFYKKPVPGKLYDYTAKQIAKYLGKSGLYSDVLAPSKDGGHR